MYAPRNPRKSDKYRRLSRAHSIQAKNGKWFTHVETSDSPRANLYVEFLSCVYGCLLVYPSKTRAQPDHVMGFELATFGLQALSASGQGDGLQSFNDQPIAFDNHCPLADGPVVT
jgi:hypothetical protein